MPKAIKLVIFYNNNTVTLPKPRSQPLHITIVFLKYNEQLITKDVVAKFSHYFTGITYNLKFLSMWGRNSLSTSSTCNASGINLETIRQEIATYVMTKYPGAVETQRYASGMGPQHINIGGNEEHLASAFGLDKKKIFGSSINVVYSLQ